MNGPGGRLACLVHLSHMRGAREGLCLVLSALPHSRGSRKSVSPVTGRYVARAMCEHAFPCAQIKRTPATRW